MSGSDLSSGPGADTVRDLVGRCGAGAGFGHMGEIDIGRNRRGGQCDHRKFGVFRRRMVLCQGCCSEFCDFGSIYRCGYVQRKATQEIHGGLSALLGLGLCRRVAAMKQYRGSFTVEASFIISWFCLLIGTMILLAFYIHDYVRESSIGNDRTYQMYVYTRNSSKKHSLSPVRLINKTENILPITKQKFHNELQLAVKNGEVRLVRLIKSIQGNMWVLDDAKDITCVLGKVIDIKV